MMCAFQPARPTLPSRPSGRLRLPARTLRRLALLAVPGLLAAASPAAAKTFCIGAPACTRAGGTAEPSLPAAVASAKTAHSAGDPRSRIEIGPGTQAYAGEADDLAGNPIDFAGSGTSATILQDSATAGASFAPRVLAVTDPGSTVSNLTIRFVTPAGAQPATFPGGGLLLRDGARATGVSIDGTQSGPSSVGLDIRGRSSFAAGTIAMPAPTGARGVGFAEAGGNTAVRTLPGSDPAATAAISATTTTGVTGIAVVGGARMRASLVRITAISSGALVGGGELDLFDSLVKTSSVSDLPASRPPSDPASALVAVSAGPNATLRADGVTVVGDGTGFGLVAGGGSGGATARLLARNVVVNRYSSDLVADDSRPTTRLDIDYSAFSRASANLTRAIAPGPHAKLKIDQSAFRRATASAAPSSILFGPHNLDLADPGFAEPGRGDYAPGTCSPLIDRGDPARLTATEPTTDLAGAPRVLSGAGFGPAVRDIGAFEYRPPRGTRGYCALASVSPRKVRIVRRLRIVQRSGRKGHPPTRKGRRPVRMVRFSAPVRLSCRAGARTRCHGVLTLTVARPRGRHRTVVLGRAAYSIAPGRSATIHVRISRRAQRRVAHARRHRLRVSAVAAQAGIPGGASTTMATFLLLAR